MLKFLGNYRQAESRRIIAVGLQRTPAPLVLEQWPADRNIMPGFGLNISHGSLRFPSCLSPPAIPSPAAPATPAVLPLPHCCHCFLLVGKIILS